MGRQIPGGFSQYLRDLTGFLRDDPRADGELLAAFVEGDQGAFAALLGRHGPAVWASCRRELGHDAEDAFQAVFIALARKAGSVRPDAVAGWLARVARDVIWNAARAARRREAARRRLCERAAARPSESPADDELQSAVHEELAALPLRLRAPLSLYYLEGKSQPDVARILCIPQQTVSDRLRRGLGVLRERLSRRGMAVAPTALVALLGGVPVASALPAGLVSATVDAVLRAVADCPTDAAAVRLAAAAIRPPSAVRLGLLAVVAGAAVAGAVLGLQPDRDGRPALSPDGTGAVASLPAAAPVPRVAPSGDPLPDGAIARIGTTRFQLGGGVTDVAWAEGGRLVAANSRGGIVVLRAADGVEVARSNGPPNGHLVASSVDGRRVVVAGTSEIWGYDVAPDGLNVRWKWSTERRQAGQSTVADMALSQDGRTVVCQDLLPDQSGWVVQLLNADTGISTGRLEVPGFPWGPLAATPNGRFAAAVAVSPEGTKATGARSCRIVVWDLSSRRQITSIPLDGLAFSLLLAPAGDRVAAVGLAGKELAVRVWAIPTGREERCWHLEMTTAPCQVLAFTPDGRALAQHGSGHRVVHRDVDTGAVTRPAAAAPDGEGKPASVLPMFGRAKFSPGGRQLAFGGESGIEILDAATGRVDGPGNRLRLPIYGLVFSPDGRRVVTVGTGWGGRSETRSWDVETGRPQGPFPVAGAAVADPGDRVEAVELGSPRQSTRLTWETDAASRWAAVHGTAPEAASAGGRGRVVRLDKAGSALVVLDATGRELRRLVVGEDGTSVRGVTLSRDGRTALALTAVGSQPVAAVVWDTESGRRRAVPLPITGPRPVLSGDGRWAASAEPVPSGVKNPKTYQVVVWEVASGSVAARLPDLLQSPPCVTFSRDHRLLAVGRPDGAVAVWDLPAAEQVARFAGHDGAVASLAFSPDGRRLVSGGNDRTGLVWDVSGLRPPPDDGRGLDALWEVLAGPDAAEADRAGWSLSARPAGGVGGLVDRLWSHPTGRVVASRVVAVLERAGTAEAVRALGALAGSRLDGGVSDAAAAALGRMGCRAPGAR